MREVKIVFGTSHSRTDSSQSPFSSNPPKSKNIILPFITVGMEHVLWYRIIRVIEAIFEYICPNSSVTGSSWGHSTGFSRHCSKALKVYPFAGKTSWNGTLPRQEWFERYGTAIFWSFLVVNEQCHLNIIFNQNVW